MKKYKRIFTIVLDSAGIGGAEDAAAYGDAGADTLGHIATYVEKLHIPNLQKLGLGNIHELKGVPPMENPMGYCLRLKEKSCGKDSMTGHWEMMGLSIQTPLKSFGDTGFPQEFVKELERRTGMRVIGNKSSSGTDILEEFGEEQVGTNSLLIYTSADSVLQICGHEEVMGLEKLYACCEIARELTGKGEWQTGRVIARPYLGWTKDTFERTANRRDYALKPFGKTALDALKDAGLDVTAVGKIKDIFSREGITKAIKSQTSVQGMEQTIEIAGQDFEGLCFVNLVDFDTLWGHRRDARGYAQELEKFDIKLGRLMEQLREDDLLMITADHGNDPTYQGFDHTREQVPLLLWSPSMKSGKNLGYGDSFGVIGATILENFGLQIWEGFVGTSILDVIS